jgi:carboxylate-amine ligase
MLLDHVTPVLAEQGELDIVEDSVAAVLERGTGATAQRRVYRQSGQLTAVVAHAVKATMS